MKLYSKFKGLTRTEWILWILSMIIIISSFIIWQNKNLITLIASLIGVTSLIFVAKADVLGQFLMVIFSLLYALISYKLKYYGEMITYLGMTAPIAILSIIVWLRNPFKRGKSEVKVAALNKKRIAVMVLLTVAVTIVFHFILSYYNTVYLIISTVSIATSFLAVYLTVLRSPYYALAYAANDIVLIILWGLAMKTDYSYLSMLLCFSVFLINDIYGFYNWQKIRKRQKIK